MEGFQVWGMLAGRGGTFLHMVCVLVVILSGNSEALDRETDCIHTMFGVQAGLDFYEDSNCPGWIGEQYEVMKRIS